MAEWFVFEASGWRRSQTAPAFGQAAIEIGAGGEYFLLAHSAAAIAINGVPLRNGITLLRHKDEIAVEGTRAYFTTEVLPQVVAFSGRAAKCGRCRVLIETGIGAVQCACGVFYHSDCFEYGEDPRCVACGRPTRLDGSGLWQPEEAE